MQVSKTDITFQSKIKIIDLQTFNQKVKKLNPKKHEVLFPWSPKDIKRGKNLFTTNIMDCIAGGIVDNGKFIMFHLGTYTKAQAKKLHQKRFDIKAVEHKLLEKVNFNNKNLHGFIIGGFQLKPDDKYNITKLQKIKHIFDKNKIPYSIMGARKDVHYFGKYSILYENKTDTLYVTNTLTNSKSLDGRVREIEICNKQNINKQEKDEIRYNVYKKGIGKFGVEYKSVRKRTGLKEFFESQFREVKLSRFDEYC